MKRIARFCKKVESSFVVRFLSDPSSSFEKKLSKTHFYRDCFFCSAVCSRHTRATLVRTAAGAPKSLTSPHRPRKLTFASEVFVTRSSDKKKSSIFVKTFESPATFFVGFNVSKIFYSSDIILYR